MMMLRVYLPIRPTFNDLSHAVRSQWHNIIETEQVFWVCLKKKNCICNCCLTKFELFMIVTYNYMDQITHKNNVISDFGGYSKGGNN